MAKKQAKREKNRVVGADISIDFKDGKYSAVVWFRWLHGAKTEMRTPSTFDTILEAAAEGYICIETVLPDLEKRLADAGVDVQDPNHGDGMALTEAKAGGETVATKPDVTQFSFVGETVQLQCDCHKGQWAVYAFAMNPADGKRHPIGSLTVKDEEDGKSKMEAFVMEKAEDFLKKNFNLTKEKAKNITVLRGEEAAQAEALAMAKIDNVVH